MAKGINNRTHLSLPHRVPDEMADITRNLGTWANGLPFGAVGFAFTRNVSEAATVPAATTVITWNNVVADRENWMPIAGTVQSIVVPPGLSGVYSIRFNVYWAVAAAGMEPFIRVNGNGVTLVEMVTIAVDRVATGAQVLLNDGDVIVAGIFNGSAANKTVTAFAGNPNVGILPSLSAWRISLL